MRPAARERGSALVFVLWIALLVSVLAAGAALAVRARIIETRIEDTVMREQALLRSALDLAAFDIALEGRNAVNAPPRLYTVGGEPVQVSRAAFHGRIDVNLADETAFLRLFAGLGAGEDLARRLTDEILDWRDGDADPRPFGAEAADYGARPGAWIGDRPFLHVGELGAVLSVTPARLACMTPYLTVQGGTGPVQGAPLDGLEPPAGSDGIRVALTARLVREEGYGRSMSGLAQFGVSQTRPFEWVSFSGDDGRAPPCPREAFRA